MFRTMVWRRFAAALALLGVLTYATVLPWHTSAMQAQRSVEGVLLAGLTSICHPGIETAASQAAADPSSGTVPADSQVHCPLCLALASVALAVLPVIALGLPEPDARSHFALLSDAGAAPAVRILPQSRGPPLIG